MDSPLIDEKILAIEFGHDRKLFSVRTTRGVITFEVSIDPTDPTIVKFKNCDLGLVLTIEDILSWLDKSQFPDVPIQCS